MPGIIGFTKSSLIASPERVLASMCALCAHRNGHVTERAFLDENLCAGRSYPDIINTEPQSVSRNGVSAWLSGEDLQ